MLKSKPDNKGFTLVELIITVAIMTLIGVAMVGIMTSNTVVFRKTKSDIDVQNVAQDTFNKISDDIMQAKTVFVQTETGTKYVSKKNTSYPTLDETALYNIFYGTYTSANMIANYPPAGAKIQKLAVSYVVPYDSRYVGPTAPPAGTVSDYCVVCYTFDSANNKIVYDITYKYMTTLNCHDSLYNDFLTSDGVNCKIDPWGDSIWLSMTFARNDRKYKSEGMVTIRNSNVLSMP